MTPEQTQPQADLAPCRDRHRARVAIGLLILSLGVILVLWPFVRPSSEWSWLFGTPDDITDATVNAEVLSIDETGLRLKQQGERHISVITPPLKLASDCEPNVRIVAALPGVPVTAPIQTTVILLWQTEAAESFHFAEQTVTLSETPSTIEQGLPVCPAEVHRIGVQFRSPRGEIQLCSIAMPQATLAERLRLASIGLAATPQLQNHSINFLRGPTILGHGLNYYLVSLVLAGSGAYVCVCGIRRRRVRIQTLAVVAVLGWCLGDLLFTRNLLHQYRTEAAAFDPASGVNPIAVANSPELAWAHACLLQHVPAGSSFSVLSDDPFTPSHRLGYLVEPQRIRRAEHEYERAEYILVFHASQAAFDPQTGMFRYKDGPAFHAEPLSVLDPGSPELPPSVYLLRRTEP